MFLMMLYFIELFVKVYKALTDSLENHIIMIALSYQ